MRSRSNDASLLHCRKIIITSLSHSQNHGENASLCCHCNILLHNTCRMHNCMYIQIHTEVSKTLTEFIDSHTQSGQTAVRDVTTQVYSNVNGQTVGNSALLNIFMSLTHVRKRNICNLNRHKHLYTLT